MIYELLRDVLGPKGIIALESFLWSGILKVIVIGTLIYYGALFLWEGSQFIGRLSISQSRHQPSISQFWRTAVVAFLAANMNLHLAMAG